MRVPTNEECTRQSLASCAGRTTCSCHKAAEAVQATRHFVHSVQKAYGQQSSGFVLKHMVQVLKGFE